MAVAAACAGAGQGDSGGSAPRLDLKGVTVEYGDAHPVTESEPEGMAKAKVAQTFTAQSGTGRARR